ncbi:NifB/NifX family molybdenum-iron cluster-binding protein [Aeromonas sobria]|uniref:NifB/NifX family molybdenum-iron cluster-binding protein n=1 Tax=Aeromonas sobria TaxID=646 RepID=UPI003F2D8A10
MNTVTTMTTNPGNSALMLSQGLLAGHFTRAEQLQILSPEGSIITTLANPAAAEGCHGKQALLDALAHHQVGQVVVRNIGERMLGRLLAANIRVLQCRSARLPLPALLAPANLQLLTDASQGRPSRRHQSKSAIRAIQPASAGQSPAHCHGGCNSVSDHCCASGDNPADSPQQDHTCCHGSESAGQQGNCCHHH